MIDSAVNSSWQPFFEQEKSKKYYAELMLSVEEEYQNFICFPPKDLIFSAFNKCALNDIKVVIIGQDPYHGEGEANGLCFSVNDGVKIPPSLKNIFAEINTDFDSIFLPTNGNLERWAEQGVLLLNASLTVRKDEANSHKHLKWNLFTDSLISYISDNCKNIIFLLWGSFAQKKGSKINREKHFVLEAGHPSPLSANRGFWFGNKHFSQANDYLKSIGKKPIDW
ncbi:uracil-DNA glycosylase [Flavobacterium urocaniciphilum]|uniref:Uracil-DNA glycosylase n=1 Tax=Flavobacterium urocaniciphilum TaxID=1299341 RepID=A0A1H8ZAS6_9FLAO|nr:uracil-DNA glycosylase [Flavobacterium urocaniciphilum]SEP61569.1 Uracil-DNA glycosylase [Flavobacterium urocaniciphilum]